MGRTDVELGIAGGDADPSNGVERQIVGNVSEKFKDSFGSIDTDVWDWVEASGDKLIPDGNVASSNFVAISKKVNPGFGTATTSYALSKGSYSVPFDLMAGMSLSVRIAGQEFAMETVGVDDDGVIIQETPVAPVAIQGTVAVTSNVATINFLAGHNFRPGDPVVLYGNAYSPLNVGPVVLTPVNLNPNQFTVPCTATNGTYTAGGFAIRKCPCGWAEQHVGIRFVGNSANNADAVSENGDRPMVINWNPGNSQTDATIPNEGGLSYTSAGYCVPFRPKGEWIIQRATEYTQFTVADQDSTTPYRSSPAPRRQNNPQQQYKYKLRFRAESFENLSQPVGAITAITKAGSTTATITCPSHGLTSNDFVAYFGVRDKTNFADVGTIQVASIVDPNTVTVVGGASYTGASYGGFLVRVNGNQNISASSSSVQSYQKTSDGLRLLLIGSSTWGQIIGSIHTLYGLVDSSNTRITALEGRYRIASINGSSMELKPVDGQDISGVSTSPVNAGGTIIANSDFRLHYAKLISYARLMTEARRSTGDRNRAQGVEILGSVTLAASQSGTWNIGTVTPGTGATNLGKAEDNAAASGDVGVFGLAVRRDALTTSAGSNGDYNETVTNRFGAQTITDFRLTGKTYRAAFQVTPAASATDIVEIAGNGTTTVVVNKISVHGIATSANQADMLLIKRSSADTGGTSTNPTYVPVDSTDGAASAVIKNYTVNPTTGTAVGAVARAYVPLSTASSGGETAHDFDFGDKGKGLLLSGTAQTLALNLNGATIAGCVLDVTIEWYEY